MNAIAVRTHQGEYYAGETVYGYVMFVLVGFETLHGENAIWKGLL